MSLKTRITSLITTFVLLCSLLTVGVFAVKNTTFNVGGDIVFNVQGIEAEVKLEELTNASLKDQTYNTGADTDKLKTFELDNDMTASQVQACYDSWSGLDMKFDSEADVLLKIRITNKTEIADNLLKVDMSATFGSANNCTISVDKATATINPGEYEIFTITFSITNKEYSANIENFAVNVNMSQTEPLVKYDSENNYYYLEMGTYGGNAVRWRYVSDVTNGIDTAVRFDPTTSTPNSTTGSKGMFILESEIFTADDFEPSEPDSDDGIVPYLSEYPSFNNENFYHTTTNYNDVLATDYAASDLRAYLNGVYNIAGNSVGSIMETIKIDSSNAIFSKIIKRSITDLYTNINKDGTAQTVPTQFYELKDTATDAFWALSYQEAYRILGDNSEGEHLIWHTKAALEYSASMWNSDITGYWLRTPSEQVGNVLYVNDTFTYALIDPLVAARPAFILEF